MGEINGSPGLLLGAFASGLALAPLLSEVGPSVPYVLGALALAVMLFLELRT